MAFTLLLRNKVKEALSEVQRLLAIDPDSVDGHYIVGVLRLRSGDNASALEEANTAIRLNPSFAQGYLLKSQALVSFFEGTEVPPEGEAREKRLERYKEAAKSLREYLKLNPDSKREATWNEQLEALESSVKFFEQSGNNRTTFSGNEVTTKARVLSKPEPSYTQRARENQVTGTVILRAIFASDGQIKYIFVLRGLPDGLTEASIAAAKRIKFAPATIKGKPVSMWMQLEYNFNLY